MCPTLCDPMDCSMPGFSVLRYLLEFAQTHVHWISDAIQPSHLLSSPAPPAFNLSNISVFTKELALCIRWPKYWSFSFSISPSNEYSQLISFGIDWFDLLAAQGTLKSLFQPHSSKASILWYVAFFMVQLSHLYITARKTIALTIQTYVHKVMSLSFNTLSRVIIALLPRSKRLLRVYFHWKYFQENWKLLYATLSSCFLWVGSGYVGSVWREFHWHFLEFSLNIFLGGRAIQCLLFPWFTSASSLPQTSTLGGGQGTREGWEGARWGQERRKRTWLEKRHLHWGLQCRDL